MVIFDVDGVLEYRGRAYPKAGELINFLRAQNISIRIITNSTLKCRKDCADRLIALGINIHHNEVVTASYASAVFLKSKNVKSCYLMLKGKGVNEFVDFDLNSNTPEYVVVGDFRDDFNFKNLNKALRFLKNGAKLLTMIPELIDHTQGDLEVNVGSFGTLLQHASKQEMITVGKPNEFIFKIVLDNSTFQYDQVLMIGDKIDTDIIGANRIGIKSALIKQGEFSIDDLDKGITPTYQFDSLTELYLWIKSNSIKNF